MSQLAQQHREFALAVKKRYDILKFKCDACKSKVVKDKLDLNSTAKASGIDKG